MSTPQDQLDIVQENEQHDVIYALRTAHQNQSQLNTMADQKANILVSVIAILTSIFITRLDVSQLDSQQFYFALFSVGFELIALLLGILVIRPRMQWRYHKMRLEELPNPLFFGFFCKFPEDEYVDFMMQRLDNDRHAREMLLRDYYQIGQVLRRKFLLLKFAYLFAFGGIVFALAVFLSLR
jgi:hypothetical protein